MTPTQRRKRTRPMKTTIRRRGRRPSKHPSHLLIRRIMIRRIMMMMVVVELMELMEIW